MTRGRSIISKQALLDEIALEESPPEVVPWYLSGGIVINDCIAAYQGKGASDYATSKLNLINPATHPLSDAIITDQIAPSWDTNLGWWFAKEEVVGLVTDIHWNYSYSLIMQFNGILSRDVNSIFCSITEEWEDTFFYTPYRKHPYTSDNIGQLANNSGNLNTWTELPGKTSGIVCATPSSIYLDGVYITDYVPYTVQPLTRTGLTFEYLMVGGDGSISYDYLSGYGVRIQSFAIYSKSLSLSEVQAITTAMQSL